MQIKEIGYNVAVDLSTAKVLAKTPAGDLMTAKQVINGERYDDCDVAYLDAPENYLIQPDVTEAHGDEAHAAWLASMGITAAEFASLTSDLSLAS